MSENICKHCGQAVESITELTTVSWADCEELWCADCIERALGNGDIYRCEHCGELTDDIVEVVVRNSNWNNAEVTEYWCSGCVDGDATECEHCGRLHSSDIINEYHVWGRGWVNLCEGCRYGDDFYTCNDCDDVVHHEDVCFDDYDDCYCPDCIDRHRRSENLHGYSHTSGSTFWFDNGDSKGYWELSEDERKAMYLGIELETDGNDDAGDLADDIADHFDESMVVCKEDGSLDDEGVEIVSQPMTPKYHLEGGMWDKIADIVIDHGGRSHDAGTCGLHIHISRAFFTEDAVYRLDRLFHRFRTQLLRFSRRSEYQLRWCSLEEDDLAEIKDVDERKKAWGDKKRFAGRYEAINNTNGKTVEVRLWRGTLNMTTFKATVQLTAGLALIVNKMEDRLADTLTWSGVKTLVRFALESEGIGHNELDEYLASRDL